MAEESYYEMSIDGKKTKLTEKMATAQSTREKKITVEVNGRLIRIMPHMLSDIKKLGGTEQRRVIKEPPKELLQPLPKKLILPRTEEPIKPLIKTEIENKPVEASYPSDEVINPITSTEPLPEPIKAPVKKTTKKPAAKKK